MYKNTIKYLYFHQKVVFNLKRNFHNLKLCRYIISNTFMNNYHISNSRSYCVINENDIDNVENNYDDDCIDVNNIKSLALKKLLYNDLNNSLIINLNKCNTFESFFEFYTENHNQFNVQHFVQSILVLNDIQRSIFKANINEKANLTNINHECFKEYLIRINKYNLFLDIIAKLTNLRNQMTPDELTCSLLYLNKLGVSIKDELLQKILCHCTTLIKNNDIEFPLTSLSRLTVVASTEHGIYSYFVCLDAIPSIINYLIKCNTSDDMILITICLNNLHQIVTKDLLNIYKNKIDHLINDNIINNCTTRCNLKILNFLNFPFWSKENTLLIRKILLLFTENINDIQSKELMTIFRAFQSQLEPAILVPIIANQANKLLRDNPSVELLACSVLYTLPEKRLELTEVAKQLIYSKDFNSNNLPTLFQALRLLKIANINLCNVYWQKVIEELKKKPMEQEDYKIARHCHRYMYFNNNLGGTYRHFNFEKTISEFIMNDLRSGVTSSIPSKFTKLAPFIIAYGFNDENSKSDKSVANIPNIIIEKIEYMSNQFSIVDCLQLSRGMQIAYEMRYKYFIPHDVALKLIKIENVLNNCTERHLKLNNLTINDINCIMRAYNNRKSSRKTKLFYNIIQKYEKTNEPLTSRLIRDITFNLNASGFRIKNMCEKLFYYILNNNEYIIGDTIEKILYCCYNLGYTHENASDDNEYNYNLIFNYSINIINRDFNYMTGLSIIQACLALCFYKKLSDTLINRVFNIDFIKRLEDEIKMCYSKETYPERVLNQVMQLNRAVCLDYPEVGVPWFQQNYIEAQMSKLPTVKSQFQNDIKEILLSFVSDASIIKANHVTPYGYKIDFVLHLDTNTKQFISPPILSNSINYELPLQYVKKYAILLLKLDAYCENDKSLEKGRTMIKDRHLEILGYNIIHINLNEWNSLYMNIPGVKIQYIKDLLQIN